MQFSWDPAKSEINLRDRGFDFEFASLVFDGVTVEQEDNRRDYGERRVIAIGRADDLILAVVFTDRIDSMGQHERRIISARKGNRIEREAYEKIAKDR